LIIPIGLRFAAFRFGVAFAAITMSPAAISLAVCQRPLTGRFSLSAGRGRAPAVLPMRGAGVTGIKQSLLALAPRGQLAF
jgi:hypothetical protein